MWGRKLKGFQEADLEGPLSPVQGFGLFPKEGGGVFQRKVGVMWAKKQPRSKKSVSLWGAEVLYCNSGRENGENWGEEGFQEDV